MVCRCRSWGPAAAIVGSVRRRKQRLAHRSLHGVCVMWVAHALPLLCHTGMNMYPLTRRLHRRGPLQKWSWRWAPWVGVALPGVRHLRAQGHG
eukprot:14893359-Alexandrium_andersonii.AAC.1